MVICRIPGECGLRFGGLSRYSFLVAPIAQSAERLHGKEKVKGSIPFRGSGPRRYRTRAGNDVDRVAR